jgi:hypothetical protein
MGYIVYQAKDAVSAISAVRKCEPDVLTASLEQAPVRPQGRSDAVPAARSAFVSHILTEAVRLAINCVPMFWYTAPNAGTGKTLLSEMPAMIVHGVEPAVRP